MWSWSGSAELSGPSNEELHFQISIYRISLETFSPQGQLIGTPISSLFPQNLFNVIFLTLL